MTLVTCSGSHSTLDLKDPEWTWVAWPQYALHPCELSPQCHHTEGAGHLCQREFGDGVHALLWHFLCVTTIYFPSWDHSEPRLFITKGELLISDCVCIFLSPESFRMSSDSKNKSEGILETAVFPSLFPLCPPWSHLMKCHVKKRPFWAVQMPPSPIASGHTARRLRLWHEKFQTLCPLWSPATSSLAYCDSFGHSTKRLRI